MALAKNITFDNVRSGAMGISDNDARMWNLIKDVPRVIPAFAYVACFLNIILAGTGSMLVGWLGDRSEGQWNKTTFMIGLMQLLSAPYLVGWVWSIYWGIIIV